MRSRLWRASSYSDWLGSSCFHQEWWLTRKRAPILRRAQDCSSKSGALGFRIPSSMSWLLAPPMVKKEYPCRSKICPRIRWITWGRMRWIFPPFHSSTGYFPSRSKFSWLPLTNSVVNGRFSSRSRLRASFLPPSHTPPKSPLCLIRYNGDYTVKNIMPKPFILH